MESPLFALAHKRSEPRVTSFLVSDRKRIEEILISHGFDKIKRRSGQSVLDVYSPEPSFENIIFELAAFRDREKSYGKLSISYPIEIELKLIYDGLVSALQSDIGVKVLGTTIGSYNPKYPPYSWNPSRRASSPCDVVPLVR